jgi:hypothetical protein
LICINIPATAGPTAPPIRLRRTVVPRDVPLNSLGVDSKTMLKPPTCINDSPTAIIDRVTANKKPVECNMRILKKPTVPIILPIIVGFVFPSLEIIKPEEGANNRNTIIKGI